MCLLEFEDGVDSKMQLVWSAPESQVGSFKHAWSWWGNWIVQWLLKTVVADLLGDFDVLNQTFSGVGTKLSGINFEFEVETINDFNESRF